MPRLTIDNKEVEAPQGSTILQAARSLGLDIPALCQLDGFEPTTSCMLCLVKVEATGRFVPSCATPVEDGMRVESETPEIHDLRRTGIELLLSDHAGDCTAPCQFACPVKMDIPAMLRCVASGDLGGAIAIIREDVAMPAVLGRLCADYCEKACRRGQVDEPAAICLIQRYVADADLASSAPHRPSCRPPTGKKVAIVGAGPAGLSAAYHLLRAGHACTLFDRQDEPGGMLRYKTSRDELPATVLEGEIGLISGMGAGFRLQTSVGHEVSLADLRGAFDAVLVAAGPLPADTSDWHGLSAVRGHIVIDSATHETGVKGVFAAGEAVRASTAVVRSMADGKSAAECIDRYLKGAPLAAPARPFAARLGRLLEGELDELMAGLPPEARKPRPPRAWEAFTDEQAREEAARCLHCDCVSKDGCKLRRYAQLYGARSNRFRGRRRRIERQAVHADVVYESGKCILCGLCVQIADRAREPLGLAFVGRGFDVRVGVPFGLPLDQALRQVARQCAEACPSGAIVLREGLEHDACGSCPGCAHPSDGGPAGHLADPHYNCADLSSTPHRKGEPE